MKHLGLLMLSYLVGGTLTVKNKNKNNGNGGGIDCQSSQEDCVTPALESEKLDVLKACLKKETAEAVMNARKLFEILGDALVESRTRRV